MEKIKNNEIGRPEIAEFLKTSRTFIRQTEIFSNAVLPENLKGLVSEIVTMVERSAKKFKDQEEAS